ncbi:phosphatidylglycerophosphatase A [Luteitalea sp. TBR-22]|uniref:phosphatidylglycerophosphatase A family protein n=1 Tax=Luteitalea sp. TBR-22 TaxID=2802971 RepID=UPI001AF65FF5|nr:phosphatidylglycerophosphatase A [Luteitalea sp. TBR-22]BCS33903.1 phosphatidylglycerophosphatase A [Luteitalea sp. TBR-22]
MSSRVSLAVATALGVGYVPFAPGTFGSLAGLAVFVAVRAVAGRLGMPWLDLVAIVVVYLLGVWAATAAESHFGHIDPGPVVIDEVLGMLVTLACVPVSVTGALVGFVLFRIFDVIKPPPCNRLEALPGGWGVMSDDLMAAIYAYACVQGLAWVAPAWMLA